MRWQLRNIQKTICLRCCVHTMLTMLVALLRSYCRPPFCWLFFDTSLNSADIAVEVFDVNVVTGSGTQQKVRIFQLVTTGMTHTTSNSSLVLNWTHLWRDWTTSLGITRVQVNRMIIYDFLSNYTTGEWIIRINGFITSQMVSSVLAPGNRTFKPVMC